MQGIQIRPVRLALGRPGWRPALAQAVTPTPVTPPTGVLPAAGAAPVPFIDSALVSFVFDILGATASGILAYAAASRKNKLAYLFGTMAGVMAFKGFADLSQIRSR